MAITVNIRLKKQKTFLKRNKRSFYNLCKNTLAIFKNELKTKYEGRF